MLTPSVGTAASSSDPFRSSANAASRESLGVVAARTSVSADLVVVTAEGDRVTLSADAERRLSRGEFRSEVRDEDGFERTRVSVQTDSLEKSFGISVEGELSREELRDLRRLFSKAQGVIRKAVKGDEDGAIRKATKLQDRFERLDSLAAFELNVDVVRERASFDASRTVATTGAPIFAVPTKLGADTRSSIAGVPDLSAATTAQRSPQPITNDVGDRSDDVNDRVVDANSGPSEVDAAPVRDVQSLERPAGLEIGATIRELVAAIREAATSRIRERAPDIVDQAAVALEEESETDEGVRTVRSLRVDIQEFFEIQASVTRTSANVDFGFSLVA